MRLRENDETYRECHDCHKREFVGYHPGGGLEDLQDIRDQLGGFGGPV